MRGMKVPQLSAKYWRILIALAVVAIVLVSLEAWTASAPQILTPQSEASLSNSLFQYTETKNIWNVSDSEGSYSFLFGMDYNQTMSPGVPSIVLIYISMLTEEKSSGFLKGTGLAIEGAKILIDGVEDAGVQSRVLSNGAVLTDRLSGVDINETGGTHQLSARLIVSTVDVNYIGYLGGSEEPVSLNGTITIG
jgi:hypothetical protein